MIAAISILGASCKNEVKGSKPKMKTGVDSVSYALGLSIGKKLKESGFNEINYNNFSSGIKEALTKDSAYGFKDEAVGKIINDYITQLRVKTAKENKDASTKFMAEKKKDASYKSTSSGVLYKVITPGNGPSPAITDTVNVHFTIKNPKGKILQDTKERGAPIEWPVNSSNMLPVFPEMLTMMQRGSTYEFIIPSELGFGQEWAEPNAAVVFIIEMY